MCAGVGGSGGLRCLLVQEVVEGSSVCWCRFRRVRKVPESYRVVCCLATLTGAAM